MTTEVAAVTRITAMESRVATVMTQLTMCAMMISNKSSTIILAINRTTIIISMEETSTI